MRLSEVLEGVTSEDKFSDAEVRDICIDSRSVKEGDLFICLKGINSDGNDFVQEALDKGAVAVVSDSKNIKNCIQVENARKAYALSSKNFFGKKCDKMKIVGVTGTNGKTTTTHLLGEILKGAGLNVGVIGTEGAKFNGKVIDTGMTTPDPYLLHKIFAKMQEEGVEYVVMEASAHALALNKLDGINFEIGVLTNITEDHLDFFGDMKTYAKAKLDFFDKSHIKLGVVCSDDELARSLIDKTNVPILWYGLDNPSDTFAISINSNFDKTTFVCNCLDDIFNIKTNLIGRYNVENTLASITVAKALGVPRNLIQLSLCTAMPVEGRFNVIRCNGFNVVVDYAHTPDGLEKVITTARELTKGRVLTLFGCGGNRDKQKRPLMGRVASDNSDYVFLTSDNPRFENPRDIISEIEKGMHGDYEVEESRTVAIENALSKCQKGDTLIIAGKGGEKYQDIMGKKVPYNDFDTVYKYFRKQLGQTKKGEQGIW